MGNYDAALDKYTSALQTYEDCLKTKNSIFYATTLSNVGGLFKTMADFAKGIEKDQYLQRAEEALIDTEAILLQIGGIT